MKKRYGYLLALPLVVSFLLFQFNSSAQKKDKDAPIDGTVLDTARWVFTADQMLPLRGRTRMLTDVYEVRYSKDTLVVNLPYAGRAFSADYGSTTSVLDFKSTDFTVKKEQGKKDSWIVTIKPNDNKEIQSMQFTIYSKTSADLFVQCMNRDAINFRGNWDVKK